MGSDILRHLNHCISLWLDSSFQGSIQGHYGSGCISKTSIISDGVQRFFVKSHTNLAMFEAEAKGLTALSQTQSIDVPKVIGLTSFQDQSFLVLEHLELNSSGSYEEMGRQLAKLHGTSMGEQYGWERNNFIGATAQPNETSNSWTEFFWNQRLAFQMKLAEQKGASFKNKAQLKAVVTEQLSHPNLKPALVHGDLWSGNAAFAQGKPVIYDPAVYWGAPEVDLAMSQLFGGFPNAFYRGYHQIIPRHPGYEKRELIYNLYHILNHHHLFGGHYLAQAQRMIQSILL